MLQFGPHILGARLAVDTGDASRNLASAQRDTRGLKQEFGGLDRQVKVTTGLLGKLAGVIVTAAGGGLVFSLGDATRQSIEFSGAMARVNTMLPQSVSAMEKFGGTVRKVARQAGADREVIADALFNALSAGVSQDAAGGFLETMSRAAVGGFTSVNTAVQGTTTVLNNWNLKATEAQRVTDAMFVANMRGVTTFEQLASSIGTVAPAASAMGLSLEEVFATVASGSKSFTTATVMTSLRQALAAIAKPSKESADLAAKLGINFSEAGLQGMGFTRFLDVLQKKTGGSMAKMVTLFGSVEAAGLILRLTSKGGMRDFTEALGDMGGEMSATEQAYGTVARDMSFKTKRLVAEIKDTVLGVGMVITEELFPNTDGMEGKFDNIREAAEDMTRKIIRAVRSGLSVAADLFKFYLLGQIGGTLKAFGGRMAAVGLAGATAGAAGAAGAASGARFGPGGAPMFLPGPRSNQFSRAGEAAGAAYLRQGQVFPGAKPAAQGAARVAGRALGAVGSIAIYGQVAAMTIYGVHTLTQAVMKSTDAGGHQARQRQDRAETEAFDTLGLFDTDKLRDGFTGKMNGSRVTSGRSKDLSLNEMMVALAAKDPEALVKLLKPEQLAKMGLQPGETEVFAGALSKQFQSAQFQRDARGATSIHQDTIRAAVPTGRSFRPAVLGPEEESLDAAQLLRDSINDLPKMLAQAMKATMAERDRGEQAEALRAWAEEVEGMLSRAPNTAASMFSAAVDAFQAAVDAQANTVLTIFHKIKDGKKNRRHGVRLSKRGLGAAKHLNPRYRLYVMRQGAGAWVVQPMPEDVTNVSVVNGGQ